MKSARGLETNVARCSTCGHRERDHGAARRRQAVDGTGCRVCTCERFVDERLAERRVWTAVARRDGDCLLYQRHPLACFGPLTPHHLRKDGQGGDYTAENIVCLCASHNGWVEDDPDEAWQLGLVVRRGETHEEVAQRRRDAGLVPHPRRS